MRHINDKSNEQLESNIENYLKLNEKYTQASKKFFAENNLLISSQQGMSQTYENNKFLCDNNFSSQLENQFTLEKYENPEDTIQTEQMLTVLTQQQQQSQQQSQYQYQQQQSYTTEGTTYSTKTRRWNSISIKKPIQISVIYNKKQSQKFPMYLVDSPSYIKIIELKFNKFKFFPTEILQFKNLTTLRLDSNSIRLIPNQLFEQCQLEIFSISDNLLTEIPQNITKQKNSLKYLDISLNRIQALSPNVISQLTNLRCLYINNNEFKHIPKDLCNLTNLQEFSLDWFKYCNPPYNYKINDSGQISDFLSFLRKYKNFTENKINSSMASIQAQIKQKLKLNQTGDLISFDDDDNDDDNSTNNNNYYYYYSQHTVEKKKNIGNCSEDQKKENDYSLPNGKSLQPYQLIQSETTEEVKQIFPSRILEEQSQSCINQNLSKDVQNSLNDPNYIRLDQIVQDSKQIDTFNNGVSTIFPHENIAGSNPDLNPSTNFVPNYNLKTNAISSNLNGSANPNLEQENVNLSSNLDEDNQLIPFINFVQLLSSNTWSIDHKNGEGQSYVHLASKDEDVGVLLNLLEQKFELIDSVDCNNNSPFSLALLEDKLFSSKTLLTNGCNVNLGGGGRSCLNIVVSQFQMYFLHDILKKGCDPNKQDVEGNSSLHYAFAAYNKDIKFAEKICNLLLEYNADPNLKNNDGWTPLHLAIKREQIEAVKYAINFNKSMKKSQKLNQVSFNLNKHGGEQGQTPLHLAVNIQDLQIIQMLLGNGANFNLYDYQNKLPQDLAMQDTCAAKILKNYNHKMNQVLFSTTLLNSFDSCSDTSQENLAESMEVLDDNPNKINHNYISATIQLHFDNGNQYRSQKKQVNSNFQDINDNLNINNKRKTSNNGNDNSVIKNQLSPQNNKRECESQQFLAFRNGEKFCSPIIEEEQVENSEDFLDQDVDENKIIYEIWQQKGCLYSKQLIYRSNNLQQFEGYHDQLVSKDSSNTRNSPQSVQGQNNGNLDNFSDTLNTLHNNNSNNNSNNNNNNNNNNNIVINVTGDNANNNNIQNKSNSIQVSMSGWNQSIQNKQTYEQRMYLVQKASNIIEYYTVSMERFRNGIESSYHSTTEKFRYLSIMEKLYIEFQMMIRSIRIQRDSIQDPAFQQFCENQLHKSSYSYTLILDQWFQAAQNLKIQKANFTSKVYIDPILEYIHYLFGHYTFTNSIDWLRQSVCNDNSLVAYESLQSILKIQQDMFHKNYELNHQYHRNTNHAFLSQQMCNSYPVISEPSLPTLTFHSFIPDDIQNQGDQQIRQNTDSKKKDHANQNEEEKDQGENLSYHFDEASLKLQFNNMQIQSKNSLTFI